MSGTPTTEELKALLEKATPAPWTGHNMVHADGRAMTPEEIGEYVCNSVRMGEEGRFLFVSGKHADGGDCDVCHTGNGPRGTANTALIALAPTLAARVVALDEASRWQPIETAPKDGTHILALCDGEYPVSVVWMTYDADAAIEHGADGWWTYSDDLLALAHGEDARPTHWMPIPPAPKEGE